MINIFKNLLKFFNKNPKTNTPITNNIDITKNLNDDPIDLVFAINSASILPAAKLAKNHKSFTIIDLNHLPTSEFNTTLNKTNIVFCANHQLATKLEKTLTRHINISHHIEKQPTSAKYIDLKKVYHLIDNTQIIIFDAKGNANPTQNLTFLAQLLTELPRHVHIVITGSLNEHKTFTQHENIFKKYDCTSRLHFYTENLESIKYPIDYNNIDLALILDNKPTQIPSQYYKYLTHQIPIFSTDFADANQLITTTKIGQIFTHQDAPQWAEQIKTYLNLSHTDREKIKATLKTQAKNLNWQAEADHFINSIINIKPNQDHKLQAIIVDISQKTTTPRAQAISHTLMAHNIKVKILTQTLPTTHTTLTHDIEYIKV